MALPENRAGVNALLQELNPRILGQRCDGFTCNCGQVNLGPATAVAIKPSGDSYPGQEIYWFMWTVEMLADDGPNWSTHLSVFLDEEELRQLFDRHFVGVDKLRYKEPYQLEVRGIQRVREGLSPAVRIQSNTQQVRFSFDWGNAQEVARRLYEIFLATDKRKPCGSDAFNEVLMLLASLNPQVYYGGPEPTEAYESTWLTDYSYALLGVATSDHVFFQNFGTTWEVDIVHLRCDVVFMLRPIS